jgi:hypothetical protein
VPQSLGALFPIAVGAGVLAVPYRGYRDGVAPAGSSFLRAWRPSREDAPLAFQMPRPAPGLTRARSWTAPSANPAPHHPVSIRLRPQSRYHPCVN